MIASASATVSPLREKAVEETSPRRGRDAR